MASGEKELRRRRILNKGKRNFKNFDDSICVKIEKNYLELWYELLEDNKEYSFNYNYDNELFIFDIFKDDEIIITCKDSDKEYQFYRAYTALKNYIKRNKMRKKD